MKTYSNDVEALLGGAAVPALNRPASEVTPGAGRPSAIVGGAFDGASRFDRSLALWTPSRRSADGDMLPAKGMADARTRDILRNDAYVAGGADLHRDNIVGGVFTLNSKPEYKVLGLDETWAQEFQEEVETKFSLWAESLENWPDSSRKNTLTGLVRLAVGIHMAAGEVLAAVDWLKDDRTRPFKTAIQMIDLDRLSNPNGVMDTPNLRAGVEMDGYGAPVAYHVQTTHPGDVDSWDKYRWKRVPVRKPWGRIQMIHIFDQTRPAQTRGIAAMVSGLKELKITKQFRDVMLQNAIVNATFAASIESEMPSDAVFAALGSNSTQGIQDYAKQYLGAIAEYAGNSKNMLLDGVRIPHLFPGTKLQLRPAGQGGPLGTEFEQSLLRYIAANLGVSYEQLSRDYSQSNYSSIRAAMTETWKYMQGRKRMVADRFATHIFSLWLEEAFNRGEITSMSRSAPNFYEGLNKEAYTSCEWIGASRGQVDELKETQAAVLRIQNKLTTREDEMGRFGKDWRKALAQMEREEKEMKKRGLIVEGSNMMNAASGAPRKKSATTGAKDA